MRNEKENGCYKIVKCALRVQRKTWRKVERRAFILLFFFFFFPSTRHVSSPFYRQQKFWPNNENWTQKQLIPNFVITSTLYISQLIFIFLFILFHFHLFFLVGILDFKFSQEQIYYWNEEKENLKSSIQLFIFFYLASSFIPPLSPLFISPFCLSVKLIGKIWIEFLERGFLDQSFLICNKLWCDQVFTFWN